MEAIPNHMSFLTLLKEGQNMFMVYIRQSTNIYWCLLCAQNCQAPGMMMSKPTQFLPSTELNDSNESCVTFSPLYVT